MKKTNLAKRTLISMIFAWLVIAFSNTAVLHADAAEAKVRFGSNYYEKNQGDRFPMGIYVENSDGSATGIGSYHVEISFDSQLIQYSEGASSIKENGVIVLDGVGDGNQNKTMIYFNALYGGSTDVTVIAATVYTTDGTAMNVGFLGTVPVRINGTPPEADADADDNVDDEADLESDTQSADGNEESAFSDLEVYDDETSDLELDDTESETNTITNDTDATAEIIENLDDILNDGDENEIPKTETHTEVITVDAQNDYLSYIIIGIATIVCIIIIVVIIRTAVRVGVHRRKLDKMMKNGYAEQDWAFEFDTIDEDKDIVEDWEYDSTVLEEDWTDDTDSVDDYMDGAGNNSEPGPTNSDSILEEKDFLFEFDSVSDKNK